MGGTEVEVGGTEVEVGGTEAEVGGAEVEQGGMEVGGTEVGETVAGTTEAEVGGTEAEVGGTEGTSCPPGLPPIALQKENRGRPACDPPHTDSSHHA